MFRLVIGCSVDECGRVEQHEGGAFADLNPAAIAQADPICGARRQACYRLNRVDEAVAD